MTKKFDVASGKASPKATAVLNTAVAVISKICEVGHWIGVVACIILAVFGFTNGAFPGANGDIAEGLKGLNVYGFESAISNGVDINYQALGWFGIGGALILCLMAMVFRNIYLIARNTRDKSPFTEDNMRMVKELGIFFIATPIIGLIFNGIIFFTSGVETSTNCSNMLIGLVMLYLTQIFARGVELEDDVKDLV